MKYLLLPLILSVTLSLNAQNTNTGRVIFYNTENFFDTIDDPKTIDEEFTPTGADHWNTERYSHKLDNISKLLADMLSKTQPIVIGLSEVENKKVCEDLAARLARKKYDLGVIEQDSPDPRGIDVALLYNKKLFTVIKAEFLAVKLPDSDKGTRDIVCVRGKVKGIEVYFMVNHWPSRREGKNISDARRAAAAMVVKAKVAEIMSADRNARIVIMGDLNDNPTDSSIVKVLGAIEPAEPLHKSGLYNLMYKPYKAGKYTLKYHMESDIFDQMIVSESLLEKTAVLKVASTEGGIYKPRWILFDHPKYGEMPNRTYSGPQYHGGFSDHLPVYIDLTIAP
jgi:exonuclease III